MGSIYCISENKQIKCWKYEHGWPKFHATLLFLSSFHSQWFPCIEIVSRNWLFVKCVLIHTDIKLVVIVVIQSIIGTSQNKLTLFFNDTLLRPQCYKFYNFYWVIYSVLFICCDLWICFGDCAFLLDVKVSIYSSIHPPTTGKLVPALTTCITFAVGSLRLVLKNFKCTKSEIIPDSIWDFTYISK